MKRIVIFSLILATILAASMNTQPVTDPYGFQQPSALGIAGMLGVPLNMKDHVISCMLSALMGGLLGAFLSDRFRKLRWFLFAIAGVIFLAGLYITPMAGQATSFITAFAFVFSALSFKGKRALLEKMKRFVRFKQTSFGSSRWSTLENVQESGLIGDQGLFLGTFRHMNKRGRTVAVPMFYTGDRHLMTVAAARGGKGVSTVIPNLLSYEGSVLAIDVKAELALMTSARRGAGDAELGIEGLGQEVHILDPWGITGLKTSCFNPMDWLVQGDPEITENAMILWDSIIVPSGSKEAFWDEEAKALGVGITLHVATAPQEQGKRTLARVREIITSGPATFAEVMSEMLESENAVVRSTAMRTMGKEEKLLSGVMATLQSHTHFLESDALQQSMSRSDFCFEDLKTKKMTVYLCLPADRIDTFSRWLRLMIQQAITVNARNIAQKPEKPILFMLDEVAALGRMNVISRAYGLMAGFGMQIWSVVQNLSQLEEIYGKGWETFIGNSGVLQYYGSRDFKTAEYFSKLAGVTTVEKFSWSQSIGRAVGMSTTKGHSHSSSTTSSMQGGSRTTGYSTSTSETESLSDSLGDTQTRDIVQRPLITPDELMVLRRDEALVLVENLYPIKAFKVKWFEHPAFRSFGVNLENRVKSYGSQE